MNAATARARGRRKLVLLALFALSPLLAAYAAYYWFAPARRVNYGELLETRPAPAIAGARADGSSFALSELRGRWVLLIVAGGECGEACVRALYATRQARTMQGPEQDRVLRVLLQPPDAAGPSPEVLAVQPGLVMARVASEDLARLPVDVRDGGILLVDPRGNLVLRYGADPDIKRLANDLQRLLRVSQIG